MNTLRTKVGKTGTELDSLDKIFSNIGQQYNVTDEIKFIKNRRKEWNQHVPRAVDNI